MREGPASDVHPETVAQIVMALSMTNNSRNMLGALGWHKRSNGYRAQPRPSAPPVIADESEQARCEYEQTGWLATVKCFTGERKF